MLASCASPITAKVTSFHVWPADAAGQTFSFVAQTGKAGELEHATYEGYVAAELARLGLKPAAAGQVGRFRVDLQTTGTTREKKVLEPVYDYRHVFIPPTRDATGQILGVPTEQKQSIPPLRAQPCQRSAHSFGRSQDHYIHGLSPSNRTDWALRR